MKTEQERLAEVNQILETLSEEDKTPAHLDNLATYIINGISKEERKEKKILTTNRMVTINKRETSYQGLAEKNVAGEDGVHALITNDKNIILSPKDPITQEEIDANPALKDLQDAIKSTEAQEKNATGRRRFQLRQQLIQMRKLQYTIRNDCRNPIKQLPPSALSFSSLDLEEHITMDEADEPHSDSPITLFTEEGVATILPFLQDLKQESETKFWADSYYLAQELSTLIDKALKEKYPLLYEITVLKTLKYSNTEIQRALEHKFGLTYSIEYISSLWRHKIPKIIATQQQEDYINWYFTSGPGKSKAIWKKCTRCGQTKLAHNRFYSRNNTSKDGFYSICKECRNKKKEKKEV